MFYDVMSPVFLTIAFILELLGIIIIGYGVAIVTWGQIRSVYKHQPLAGQTISHELSTYLLLALDYMLGSEIIKTVVARTIDELIIVGTIIILRGGLGYVIRQEAKA